VLVRLHSTRVAEEQACNEPEERTGEHDRQPSVQKAECIWVELRSGPLLAILAPEGWELFVELLRHHSVAVELLIAPLKDQDAYHTLDDEDSEPKRTDQIRHDVLDDNR